MWILSKSLICVLEQSTHSSSLIKENNSIFPCSIHSVTQEIFLYITYCTFLIILICNIELWCTYSVFKRCILFHKYAMRLKHSSIAKLIIKFIISFQDLCVFCNYWVFVPILFRNSCLKRLNRSFLTLLSISSWPLFTKEEGTIT